MIHQLKRELADLKRGYKGLGDVSGRLNKIEHKYRLLHQDKNNEAEKFRLKNNELQSKNYQLEIDKMKLEIELKNKKK